jgi:hypothetical protein
VFRKPHAGYSNVRNGPFAYRQNATTIEPPLIKRMRLRCEWCASEPRPAAIESPLSLKDHRDPAQNIHRLTF